MSEDIPYHIVSQPMSRDRHYSFARYSDGSVMLVMDTIGMTTTIHLTKIDAEVLKRDFNVG